MKSQDFWQRKRQELQPARNNNLSRPGSSNLPWWQDPEYTKSVKDVPTEPIDIVDTQTGQHHDFSRANHLKDNSGNCPNCGSSDFMSPSPSAATRCFSCGYIQGRVVNDLDTFPVMSSEAKTLKVRQTADGGAQKYRARISRNSQEIKIANAELEQSFQGKARIDS